MLISSDKQQPLSIFNMWETKNKKIKKYVNLNTDSKTEIEKQPHSYELYIFIEIKK